MSGNIVIYIAVSAVVTYFIRMLPSVIFRKKIKSKFARSFLFYVPYAVLGAMTIPAVFYATGSIVTSVIGLAVAVILAFKEKSLITVALCSCGAALIAEAVCRYILNM